MKTPMATINTLLAVLVLALGATQLSCSVNDYCLNCGTGDAGNGGDGDANDGGDGDAPDAPPDMATCVPDGTEVCDGKDNDCNGLVDDGVLPEVGELCANQVGACQGGTKICSSGHIVCDKQPMPESCNDADDNCNGDVDEGDPGGGALCGTNAGACVAGTMRCTGGTVTCEGFADHRLDPEMCNGQDDDCDDDIDEDVGSLGTCGPDASFVGKGICTAGTLQCSGGVPVCMGAVFPKFETCNHIDDDCDGTPDDGFDTANDPNNCGDCVGTGFTGVVCQAASKTCINATNAGAMCTDATTCTAGTGLGTPACVVNSRPICSTGDCDVACNAGFHDLNGNNADGCEYKCSPTGPEVCDGIDNDCDGLLDSADGDLMLPTVNPCKAGGECSVGLPQTVPPTAPTPVCDSITAKSWVCNYQGDVGDETCDDKNNDCDANTDENYPLKNTACSDKEPGKCLDVGTFGCAPDETSLVCNDTTSNPDLPFVGPAPDEDCNAVDDDCDGTVDEDIVTGRDWVSIGGGVEMMQYEASRPDADSSKVGVDSSTVCSKPGVLPWTTVTYTEAEAECAAIGARLCTESEWHRTCSDVTPPTFPISIGTGATFEAEYYSTIGTGTQPSAAETVCGADTVDNDNDGLVNDGCATNTGNASGAESGAQCRNSNDDDGDGAVNDGCPANTAQTRAWVPDSLSIPGNSTAAGTFSGIAEMEAVPNIGGALTTPALALAQGPRLSYSLSTLTTGTAYHVMIRMYANSASDNTVYVGLTGTGSATTPIAVTASTFGSWVWVDAGAPTTITPTTATATLNVYMGGDGVKIDQIRVQTSATLPTDPARATLDASRGGTWAFKAPADPLVYQTSVCNGDDLDTNAVVGGDQDDILATHSLLSCAADVGTGVFDMSGNVKEWTKAHQPGENPIRGGASNNSKTGISCALNFTLADDNLKLPNIGFRCCR